MKSYLADSIFPLFFLDKIWLFGQPHDDQKPWFWNFFWFLFLSFCGIWWKSCTNRAVIHATVCANKSLLVMEDTQVHRGIKDVPLRSLPFLLHFFFFGFWHHLFDRSPNGENRALFYVICRIEFYQFVFFSFHVCLLHIYCFETTYHVSYFFRCCCIVACCILSFHLVFLLVKSRLLGKQDYI